MTREELLAAMKGDAQEVPTGPVPSPAPTPAPEPTKLTREQILAAIKGEAEEPESSERDPYPYVSAGFKALRQVITEPLAANIEALGFDTSPFKKAGEFLQPEETRSIRPGPAVYAKSGYQSDSPLWETVKETVKEAPERLAYEAMRAPAFMLQYAILGPVARFLKVPAVTGLAAKPIARGLRAATELVPGVQEVGTPLLRATAAAGKRVATQGAQASATMGLQMGLGELLPSFEDKTLSHAERVGKGLSGFAKGAAMGLGGELVAGGAAGMAEAKRIPRLKAAVEAETKQFQTTQEIHDFAVSKGIPEVEAAQLAEKVAHSKVLYPILREAGMKPSQDFSEALVKAKGRTFQTQNEVFSFLREQGMPPEAAAAATQKLARENTLYPVLSQSIEAKAARAGVEPRTVKVARPMPGDILGPKEAELARQGAVGEGVPPGTTPKPGVPERPIPFELQEQIAAQENRLRSRVPFAEEPMPMEVPPPAPSQRSLSEAVADAGGISLAATKDLPPITGTESFKAFTRPDGSSLARMHQRMLRMGYDAGATPEEFAHRLVQDATSKEAGFRTMHRFYQEGGAPTIEPAALQEAYEQYGVSPKVAQKVASETASRPPGPTKQAALVERSIAESEAEAVEPGNVLPDKDLQKLSTPRPGETVLTASGEGGVNILRGEKDITDRAVHGTSFPEIARLNPVVQPIYRAARHLYTSIFPSTTRAVNNWVHKFKSLVPEPMRIRVADTMREEETRGLRYGPQELASKGIVGDAAEMYFSMRRILESVGVQMRELGMGTKDVLTYVPRVWKGQFRIIGPRQMADGTTRPGTLARVESEKDAIKFAEEFFKTNPDATLKITNPVEIPDHALAILPKHMHKNYIANVRAEMGPAETDVTRMSLEAVKKRGGRFFANVQQRTQGLETYVKDPLVWFPEYVQGWNRKYHLDQFNKLAYRTLNTIDPAQKNLFSVTEGFIDFMNNPRSAGDGLIAKTLNAIGGNHLANKFLKGVTKFEALWKLGLNPLSPMLNFHEVWWNTHTILGTKGTVRGFREMLRLGGAKVKEKLGFAGAKTARVDLSRKVLTDLGIDEGYGGQALFDEYSDLSTKGMIDPLWLFKKSEWALRGVTGLGKFYEVYNGKNYDDALAAAEQLVDRAHLWLSPAHVPGYMRSDVARALLQFKAYPLKELEFFLSLTAKEKAFMTAKILGTTGVAGMPFIQDLNTVLDFKARHPKLARGFYGLAGLDVSDSLSPYTAIVPQSLEAKELLTPAVGDIQTLLKAAKTRDPRDIRRAIRVLTPVQVNRMADVGKQLATGMARYPATGEAVAPVTTKESLIQLFGPKSAKIGGIYAAKRLEQKMADKLSRLRRSAVEKLQRGEELTPEEEEAFANSKAAARASRRLEELQEVPLSERLAEEAPRQLRDFFRQLMEEQQQ